MLCWWQGNSREKSHSFFPPLLVCVLDEEQPASSWSRSKFYSISVNGSKQNHSILLGIPPGEIERHLLLREGPENCSETYFDCTAWTRRCLLCWSYCELSSASLLLQKQKWLSWHFLTYLERTDAQQAEGLNPLLSTPTGCSLGEKRRGKLGPTPFEKREKTAQIPFNL